MSCSTFGPTSTASVVLAKRATFNTSTMAIGSISSGVGNVLKIELYESDFIDSRSSRDKGK